MPDGQVKAIELQGIVRNRTKIGVQDGQAEDLLNLRFVNGAWRTSGNGRQIEFQMGASGVLSYSQLYVHTNIYRHLLGVYTDTTTNVSTLYWFADIESDGVTFTPLATPVALTTVHGDLWISQTGHLLTVIDGADDFEYFVFKTGTNEYVSVNMDSNGKPDSRKLYPFGEIHFNLLSGDTEDYMYSETDDEQYIVNDPTDINVNDSPACIPKSTESTTHAAAQIWHAQMLQVYHKATEDNRFTSPFLIVAALKLYDGSYAFATQPVLLNPRENMSDTFWGYGNMRNAQYINLLRTIEFSDGRYAGTTSTCYDASGYGAHAGITHNETLGKYICEKLAQSNNDPYPVFTSGCSTGTLFGGFELSPMVYRTDRNSMQSTVLGSDIALSIKDLSIFLENKDIFTGLAIFITPQSFLFDMSEEGYKEGVVIYSSERLHGPDEYGFTVVSNASYFPRHRAKSEVIYDLFHSPFYLLREYSINELNTLKNTIKVDLTEQQFKNVLLNITAQPRLDYESTARATYIPKASYMYNGRLHIANYKAYPYYGYPIDLFHLHDHSVQYDAGSWFPADEDGKRVLPDLVPYHDDYLQHPRSIFKFYETGASVSEEGYVSLCRQRNLVYACVKVIIDSSQGEKVVVRYIPPYTRYNSVNGRADFIESLNPLLSYPDARAKKMCVYVMCATTTYGGQVKSWYGEFDLNPHPYLNIAYYIASDLKPISLSSDTITINSFMDSGYNTYADAEHPMRPTKVPDMSNIEEHFPNGLKVSKTNNPLFFPVENAYQVGSAEILALMSNAIAVGTGQTGDAPLYVFCRDGIYALFVSSSGEMTYTNSRVIARDVCNNPRSVTPTDQGVVFTTDRGLMMIAGEQVQEIGEPAEGDVFRFWDSTSVDYIKTAKGAMSFVAQLPPATLCDGTDFLTFLTGAIVNYNHNERELMISNPQKNYSYILDREGNWSRRDYTAAQYVNNYPTSYRVSSDGHFYKVDEEGTNNTPLEQRKEADNKFFYISNVTKLDSIGFKRAQRFVLRGQFETIPVPSGTVPNYIGCYVFGSYDGRKWGLLGIYEKTGSFTDIGCTIERTDMRFFRVCLAGQVTGKSRIDYMEISSTASVLGAKIR